MAGLRRRSQMLSTIACGVLLSAAIPLNACLARMFAFRGTYERTDRVVLTWDRCRATEPGTGLLLQLRLPADTVKTSFATWVTDSVVLTVQWNNESPHPVNVSTTGIKVPPEQVFEYNVSHEGPQRDFTVQARFRQKQIVRLAKAEETPDTLADQYSGRCVDRDVVAKIMARLKAGAPEYAPSATRLNQTLRYLCFGFCAFRYARSESLNAGCDVWVDKRGDCDDFVRAQNVVLREVGMPCRVVAGIPVRDKSGLAEREVANKHDLHAMGEVYEEGTGWIQYEPLRSENFVVGFVRLTTSSEGDGGQLTLLGGVCDGDLTWDVVSSEQAWREDGLRHGGEIECGPDERMIGTRADRDYDTWCRHGKCSELDFWGWTK